LSSARWAPLFLCLPHLLAAHPLSLTSSGPPSVCLPIPTQIHAWGPYSPPQSRRELGFRCDHRSGANSRLLSAVPVRRGHCTASPTCGATAHSPPFSAEREREGGRAGEGGRERERERDSRRDRPSSAVLGRCMSWARVGCARWRWGAKTGRRGRGACWASSPSSTRPARTPSRRVVCAMALRLFCKVG
jgi:hypothetical protein